MSTRSTNPYNGFKSDAFRLAALSIRSICWTASVVAVATSGELKGATKFLTAIFSSW